MSFLLSQVMINVREELVWSLSKPQRPSVIKIKPYEGKNKKVKP
jgi:hypothetical protein